MVKPSDKKSSQDKTSSTRAAGKADRPKAGTLELGRMGPIRGISAKDRRVETKDEYGANVGESDIGMESSGEVTLTTVRGSVSRTERDIMSSQYGQLPPAEQTPDGKFKCSICGQTFDTLIAYKEHYRNLHQ